MKSLHSTSKFVVQFGLTAAARLTSLLIIAFRLATTSEASEVGLSTTPIFSSTLKGDFVVAGRYSRVFGAPTPQSDPFTVTLGGIPAGSSIVAAFANWTYLTDVPGDANEAAISINGNPVTGSVSIAHPDLGWGKSASASYTANVTALVTGNGIYAVGSAVDEPINGSYGEGFSLLAVFSNPLSPVNRVHVYSGFTSNTSNPPEGFAPALAVYNFTLGAYVGGPAHFFINAIDGQVGADQFSINGVNAGGILPGTGSAADAWRGLLGPAASGNLYDHAEGDVSAFMSAGQTSLTASTAIGAGAAGDAVGHSFGAITFAVPEPGSAALLALGALLLAILRRNSKQTANHALHRTGGAVTSATSSLRLSPPCSGRASPAGR